MSIPDKRLGEKRTRILFMQSQDEIDESSCQKKVDNFLQDVNSPDESVNKN